jgi:hypothetical protein
MILILRRTAQHATTVVMMRINQKSPAKSVMKTFANQDN